MSISTIETRAVCPRSTLVDGFVSQLQQTGYAPSTIQKHKRLFASLIDWLQAQELTVGDLSFQQLDRFLCDRRSAGISKLKTRKALHPILDYLHRKRSTLPHC